MNFLDFQFGRSQTKWVNEFVYPWDYDRWHAQVKDTEAPRRGKAIGSIASISDWEKKSADIRRSVEWMLGEKIPLTLAIPFVRPRLGDISQPAAPPRGGTVARTGVTLFDDIHGTKASGNSYGMIAAAVQQVTKRKITFPSSSGFGTVEADVFTANNAVPDAKLPAVIWLHGYSSSLGYSWVYHYDLNPVLALAQ